MCARMSTLTTIASTARSIAPLTGNIRAVTTCRASISCSVPNSGGNRTKREHSRKQRYDQRLDHLYHSDEGPSEARWRCRTDERGGDVGNQRSEMGDEE
jgi:hypothetical protein